MRADVELEVLRGAVNQLDVPTCACPCALRRESGATTGGTHLRATAPGKPVVPVRAPVFICHRSLRSLLPLALFIRSLPLPP